jgi:predicted small metal-binding protein
MKTWIISLNSANKLMFVMAMCYVSFEVRAAKRDEVTGEWKKLHIEELHNLYSSPDIIRQVKSRRMRWAGHVARMG